MVSPDDAVALGASLSAEMIKLDTKDVLILERLDLEDTVRGRSTQQGKSPLIVNHGEKATASSNHGVDVTRHNKYEGGHPLNNTYSNRLNLLHSFPHNLWIKTDAIKPYLVIVKNSRLPTSNTITVFATRNYRGDIKVVVSERESGVLGSPGTWGPFLISGLPQRPKRIVQVDCTIGIDKYGNIYLVALASDTGKHYPFTISSNNILSSHEIIQLVTDLERKRKDHQQRTKLVEIMNLDIFGVFLDCFQASLQERDAKADTQEWQEAIFIQLA